MEKLENVLHDIFNERGITAPNWRIKITQKETIGRSDWAYVFVDIYAPKKKKPCQNYKLAINFVRKIINWDKSEWYNLQQKN